METTISVTFIDRLSRTSVQRARNAINAEFSDGRHVVVVPVMGYHGAIRSIEEIRLCHDRQLLALVSFRDGNVKRTSVADPRAILADYLLIVDKTINADTDDWVKNPDFDHVQKVMRVLKEVYPYDKTGEMQCQ